MMHTTIRQALNLSSVEMFSKPFPYFVSTQAFCEETATAILNWLETDVPWKLVETDFYEQYEFSLFDIQLPQGISFLMEASFLSDLKSEVESLFHAGLSERIDLTVHKLIPGQRIRLHNDFLPGEETHRLLIQLNRGWTDEMGGLLLFFNSANPTAVHRIFRPLHNSLVGFAISPDSHHAVSTIHGGGRFTLVYSFYGEDDRD